MTTPRMKPNHFEDTPRRNFLQKYIDYSEVWKHSGESAVGILPSLMICDMTYGQERINVREVIF
jgi:hypothetical protein